MDSERTTERPYVWNVRRLMPSPALQAKFRLFHRKRRKTAFYHLHFFRIGRMSIEGGVKVTKQSIVVCDSDEAYVRAFAAYLMECLSDVTIVSFTSEEAFLASEAVYSIGILSKDFLSVLEFSGKKMVHEKFYLCDEIIASEYEHLPMVYKYQSMEIVEEMLKRLQQKETSSWWHRAGKEKTQFIGIYSPISHELQLPFALSLAQVYRESGKVLFLDMEELSILQMLTKQQGNRSFVDLLYLMTRQEAGGEDIRAYTNCFMGVDYVSPFAGPEEMADVEKETWVAFFQQLMASDYDTVVLLFGRTIRGFQEIISGCQELIVLGKPGDYYRMSQGKFVEYAENHYMGVQVHEVLLPMSAGNLVDGTYAVEELIQGNLGMFVRRMIRQGVMAQGLAYGIG